MSTTGQPVVAFPGERRCPVDPPAELAALQARSGLHQVCIWDGSTPWIATRYDDVRRVLSDPRLSADPDNTGYPHHTSGSAARKKITKMFVSMDDPEHRELRRLITHDFTVKNAEAMRHRIQEVADDLIDAMLAGPRLVDLVESFSITLPSIVICDMLGVPYEDRELFHGLTHTMISRAATPERAIEALAQMHAYMRRLIEHKRAHPTDDMVSRLVIEKLDTGEVREDDLVAMLELLLIGGHDTTNNTIALGVAVLLEHPDAFVELRDADDHGVATAVEEVLRFLSIIHMGRGRAVLADTDINGHRLRTGQGVIAAINVANRDPEVFHDPDTLNIRSADARRHVAFGFGIHQCLGQSLARVELQVAFRSLARRIPGLALAVPFDELPFKHDSVVYGVHELPVTW